MRREGRSDKKRNTKHHVASFLTFEFDPIAVSGNFGKHSGLIPTKSRAKRNDADQVEGAISIGTHQRTTRVTLKIKGGWGREGLH